MNSPIIRSKSIDPDHRELVNGPLYIPVLGRLFPRLWGDRREVQRTRYLVHTDAGSFEVSEEEFGRRIIGEPFLHRQAIPINPSQGSAPPPCPRPW